MAITKFMTSGLIALSLVAAPISAQANTRASDQSTAYVPAEDDDDDDGVAVWVYLFGGVGILAVFAAAIDSGSGKDKPTIPNNQSNGAN